MTPHPSILLGLRVDDRALREPLQGWVQRLGFRTHFTTDVDEALQWLSREDLAASIVDSAMGRDRGEEIWRTIRPVYARRTVLLARDHRRGLWFEALRSGVATVLPLPPRESMVRAAVAAATHAWRGRDGRYTTSSQDTITPDASGHEPDASWDQN